MKAHGFLLALVPVFVAPGLTGCSSVYYATLEKFGVEKRSILADRIEEARDDQEEAKERFRTTLETFQSLTRFDGGELEDAYSKFSSELARSEGIAKRISNRIESIDEVAADLFEEWSAENQEYANAELRAKSDVLLSDTREKYGSLIGTMRAAEARMEPVLVVFRDQVRFLKHNLNAQAISSLKGTTLEIESEVQDLIRDMQASIDEADAFIESMATP